MYPKKNWKNRIKTILTINPWVTDFAFYDLWFKPLGLLYISTILKNSGFNVRFMDLLQSHKGKRKYGKGKVLHTEIETPDALKWMERKYYQYGIADDNFRKKLENIEKPDLILMTSFMTYWYPGIVKTAEILKEYFPHAKIVLGGIYATLMTDHAKKLKNVDYVISGNDYNEILLEISKIGDFKIDFKINGFDDLPIIDYSFYSELDSITTINSIGCPFHCPYCAAPILYGNQLYKSIEYIKKEFDSFIKYNVKDIAFYDDAFLMHPAIKDILKALSHYPFRFHLPNGIHARFVTEEIAELLFNANFTTLRIGYEVSDASLQKELGGKVNNRMIIAALTNLKRAGYKASEIGVYILGGHPKIPVEVLEHSISFLSDLGVRIYISEYSPVPGTPEGDIYYDKLREDPLLTNNSLMRFIKENEMDKYRKLKNFVRKYNGEIAG